MNLHSCQNCWFNGLQYGAIGLPVGYCSKHKTILNAADATTCGLQMRKDLPLKRARQVSGVHSTKYSKLVIATINGKEVADEVSSNEKDLGYLRTDTIADVVCDYGLLESKIESLAQLKAMSGSRAEVAMASLARGYISNCVNRNGKWTSGLHLFWWTKKRLLHLPEISISDLRINPNIHLFRQVELTAWSVVMLRLTLIDDVVEHAAAEDYPVANCRGLLQKSAEAVQTFSSRKLMAWMKKEASPALDKMLPYDKYIELSTQLHKDVDNEIQS